MNANEAEIRLRTFLADGCDLNDQYVLAEVFEQADAGLDVVETIIRFFSENDGCDFGAPGPLAHFVETFYQKGYEQILLNSLERKPAVKTLELLNRVINGTSDATLRAKYIKVCSDIAEADRTTTDPKSEARRLMNRYVGTEI